MILAMLGAAAICQGAAAVDTLRYDRKGRPVVAASVNGKGPFDMVVDTAAQTSLVTVPLATELSLPSIETDLKINGVADRTNASLFGVDRFASAFFTVDNVALPALPNARVTDARGIIGMEEFAGRKLVFDRAASKICAVPSEAAPEGFIAHKGTIAPSGLLSVPVVINGVTVQALVDSGAEGTIVGAALLDRLGWAADDARLKTFGTIRGAGAANVSVRSAVMDSVSIGPVKLSNVPIIVTGRSAAEGGQGGTPSLILGSDLLNLLDAYAIDFPRGELHIRIPQKPSS